MSFHHCHAEFDGFVILYLFIVAQDEGCHRVRECFDDAGHNEQECPKKNIDIRMDCLIRRNEYLLKHGYNKDIVPLLVHLHHFCKQSIKTYIKCLWMLVSKGVLFQGLYIYFKR